LRAVQLRKGLPTMPETFNIYCDESCHLVGGDSKVMALGAVWCKATKVVEISRRIREIKVRNGVPGGLEVKWVKASKAKVQLYLDLVDFFFDDDDLHFRCVLIPDKSVLDHGKFGQTHDEWYYKMVFRMVETIICPTDRFRLYLDIKDTHAWQRCLKLHEVIRNARYDHSGSIIERVQPVRSQESELLQICDILLGAVTYHNRGLQTSASKLEVVRRIQRRSGKSLHETTWLRESKCNILRWQHGGGDA
jgi:hypothetical protein